IRPCHRDQPQFRMLCQYRKGRGCAFDRDFAAKVLVPLRRGYPERLKAARTGEHFFHCTTSSHRITERRVASRAVEQRTQGQAACQTLPRACRLLTQPGPRVSDGEDGAGLSTMTAWRSLATSGAAGAGEST